MTTKKSPAAKKPAASRSAKAVKPDADATKADDAAAAKRKRRTTAERDACIDYAQSLLEIGIPPYVVAQRLQRKHQLTRSTAWRDVQLASEQRGKEGIKKQPDVLELRDSLVNLIFQSAVEAADDSDFSSLTKLSKEVRELAKLGGFEHRASMRDDPALTACRDLIGRD